MIYLLDKDQEVIEIVPSYNILELWQDMGINEIDTLNSSIIIDANIVNLLDSVYYIGIADVLDKHSFNIYKTIKKEITNTEIRFQGIQFGFDELSSKGYIQDIRPKNQSFSTVLTRVLEDTGWSLGFVDSRLPNVTTSLYYQTRLESISTLIRETGAEIRFKVSISNNKITDKYVEAYLQMGEDTGKRFVYGTNSLEVVAEENTSELYTAAVGRGRGEEVSSPEDNPSGQAGFGRKITFADVEWSKSNGDPVDKPLGQEWVEIPEATNLFGHMDGTPRMTLLEYSTIEDPEELLQATYNELLTLSRPKVQFKTAVNDVGELHVGDTVSIVRHDIDLKYQARVFKVRYNRLDLGSSELSIGDVVLESPAKKQANFRRQVSQELEQISRDIETTYIIASDGTRISFGKNEPEVMKVDDIWYEELENGSTRLRVWDGNYWVIKSSDAFGDEIKGRVDEIEDTVEDVNEKAQGTIDNINQVVADNGFTNLGDLFASKISGEEAETMFYQEAEAIGLVYMEDGVQKAIIGIEEGIPYIRGEHVILDGNTIVDGTFEVTESMLSPEAVIGQLRATGIDASEINVINLTVDSLTGGSIDLAKGFRIINNGVPILDVNGSTGEVVMNISKLKLNAVDMQEELDRIQELEDGKDAYELALENGFVGTMEEWLESLKGDTGDDGTTTYTWVKYADTPTSGMDDFSDGKKYIGLAFNQTTATESTSYGDYQWSLMPQNIEIGGRNYFQYVYLSNRDNFNLDTYSQTKDTFQLEPNTEYTLHAKKLLAYEDGEWGVLNIRDGTNYPEATGSIIVVVYNHRNAKAEIENFNVKFTTPDSGLIYFDFYDHSSGNSPDGQWFTDKLVEAQIFRGDKVLDWTEAPEDTQARLDDKVDRENLENYVPVEGYQEEIGEINTSLRSYVSMLEQSQADIYGLYELDEDGNPTDVLVTEDGEIVNPGVIAEINDLLNRSTVIENNLGEFTSTWEFLETKIIMGKEGMLVGEYEFQWSEEYQEEIPVLISGIMIGSDRIDFVNGNHEEPVAFITGNVLQINHGIFVKTLQVGEHKIETILGGHTIWQWIDPQN